MGRKNKSWVKGIWFLALVSFFLSFSSIQGKAQPTLNIGFVDLKKVFQEYKKTQEVEEKFKAQEERNQVEFRERKEEIDELKDKLKAQESILSKEALREQVKKIEEKSRELRAWQQHLSEELRGQRKKYTEEIVRDILAVIKSIAVQEDYQLILDRGTLLYASPEKRFDLTEKVLSMVNEQYKQD